MTGASITNILMDVDTGVDDAMALALAVASPELNLIGVTTVAGNVSLTQATENTLKVLDFVGAHEVPVYCGMSTPLVRDHFDAAHYHGEGGLGGATLPASHRACERMTAPEFIVQSARAYQGDLTLVFVGPLSNLAVALALEPDLPKLVRGAVIMGGAFTVGGNATPWAEFNIAVDPEAARIVVESDLDTTWVGLDVTHSANLHRRDWESIQEDAPPTALLVREVCRRSFMDKNNDEVHLHDPLAVGVLLNPEFVKCQRSTVLVDTSVRDSAGRTRMVADGDSSTGSVALSVRSEKFREFFGSRLGVPIIGSEVSDNRQTF
jgi:purine nucleosidase